MELLEVIGWMAVAVVVWELTFGLFVRCWTASMLKAKIEEVYWQVDHVDTKIQRIEDALVGQSDDLDTIYDMLAETDDSEDDDDTEDYQGFVPTHTLTTAFNLSYDVMLKDSILTFPDGSTAEESYWLSRGAKVEKKQPAGEECKKGNPDYPDGRYFFKGNYTGNEAVLRVVGDKVYEDKDGQTHEGMLSDALDLGTLTKIEDYPDGNYIWTGKVTGVSHKILIEKGQTYNMEGRPIIGSLESLLQLGSIKRADKCGQS